MNQEKIGKFISELRKKKNMTQLDLANKLGVTDRAISKWENGRGLPDLSLLKPLCEELNISINESLILGFKRFPSKIKCPVLLTGSHSVIPSTIPRITTFIKSNILLPSF